MASGVMPQGRSPPWLASADWWWVVLLLLLVPLQRLETTCGGAAPASPPLNKLVLGQDLKIRPGTPLFCYCHGDRGIDGCCPAAIPRSTPWCGLRPLTSSGVELSAIPSVRAPWRRTKRRPRSDDRIFNNMLVSCCSGGRGGRVEIPSSSRHGGGQEDELNAPACWESALQQGSSEGCLASPADDSADFVAIPKLWLCLAMAIYGHKDDLVVLHGDAPLWRSAAVAVCGRLCVVVSLKIAEFSYGRAIVSMEQDFQWCCCTMLSSPGGVHAEEAVLFLFGFFHQRWTTTSLSLIPRFNRGDFLRLSSVMVHIYQQLKSPLPQVHTLDRPSGEPPTGHQPVRSAEALGDCGCGILESVLSTDDRWLFGSIGNLRFLHVIYLCRPSYTYSVQLGTSVSCSVLKSHVICNVDL